MIAHLAAAVCLAVCLAALALLHLRHSGLAMLTLAAPLPGIALGAGIANLLEIEIAGWLQVWLPAVLLAMLWADAMVTALLDGEPAEEAVELAGKALRGPALLSVAAAVAAAMAARGFTLPSVTALGPLWAIFSVLALMPLARAMRFEEDFIAAVNRTRERQLRWTEALMALTRPRWGLALSGIGLVFAAVAGFGLGSGPGLVPPGILAAVSAVAAFGLARDWRIVLAAALALGFAAAMSAWSATLSGQILSGDALKNVLALLTGSAVMTLRIAAVLGCAARPGNDPATGACEFLTRGGPGLAAAALALFLGGAAFVVQAGDWALVVAGVFAAAAPLLFQFAFAAAIEALFPRAAAIAARYRVH